MQGHPVSSCMYDTMRRVFYWRFMANKVCNTVRDCGTCARTRGSLHEQIIYLSCSLSPALLEFIAMDLFGPFLQSSAGTLSILVITDRYSKLSRIIDLPSTKTRWWPTPFCSSGYFLTFSRTACLSTTVLNLSRMDLTSFAKPLAQRHDHHQLQTSDKLIEISVQQITFFACDSRFTSTRRIGTSSCNHVGTHTTETYTHLQAPLPFTSRYRAISANPAFSTNT